MSRGLANAAARRSAAPRSGTEPAARARAPQPPAPRTLGSANQRVPTTRERMQASFGVARPAAEATAAAGEAPVLAAAAAPALAVVPPVVEAVTTRDRIVNRALSAPEPAPPSVAPTAAPAAAGVVDIAAFRDRRREREPEPVPVPPSARGPPAPVVELVPKPEVEEPERGDAVATTAPARAGPAAPAEAPAAPAPVTPASDGAAPSSAEPVAAEAEPAPPQAAASPPAAAEPAAAPPVPAVVRNPEDEPGFQAMKERTQRAAARTKRHQTGREAADTAQAASAPDPQQDVNGMAAAERVGTMAEKEPGDFDAEDFKTKVKAAVEGMAPPATLEEADEFEETGKAAGATSVIERLVLSGRENSQREIRDETATPPDPKGKKPKPVSEMVNDKPGPQPPGVGAAEALPGRRPADLIDLSSGPSQVEAKMVEANVTEEQLARANEPEFTGALDARREVREHAEADPADYRVQEGLVLARGRAEAEGAAAAQLEGMHGARVGTLGAVLGAKNETKTADQLAHEKVHAALLDIHTRTQADVKTILETLDATVETLFTSGEKTARDEFESYVDRKMRAYKADRYGGRLGGAYWLKDKFFDLPDEVNAFYEDGRQDYLAAMDRLIDLIAAIVGLLLGAAKLRIEAGRLEVATFVEGLDASRRTLGAEAAADLDNRFDQLDSDVDAKRDELVDTVARKYVESRDDLDARIEELQEANKGLVSKAIDAVVGVIKTIYELSKLLLRVLLKAADAIGDIVAHPIRFLENLVGAVKGGLDRFVGRIGVHLQNSLLELLFGELGSAGITMPKQLDFAGILDLVLQVLGLTYQSVRARVVKRFGEDVVVKMEEKVDIFKTLVRDGVAGLWTLIREKLADLEDLVVGKIKAYIVERVVAAGIGYIVALLNPAAAFIKACQGIYQIVMFIVERAKQIAEFVEAVLDSITAIAQGNIGAAVDKIEGALANGLSLAIAFLARLANLGALSEKVRSIIALVRKPITRVVDQVIFRAAQIYRRTLTFVKGKVQPGEALERGEQPPEKLDEPAAEPGGVAIREPFDVAGEQHEIADDGTERLTVSSGATLPVSDIDALTALHGQYRALPATATQAERRAIIQRMIVLLQANPSLIGRAARQLGDPPNLGAVNRHGANTGTSFRPRGGEPQFAALWEMESEHVLSRGVVSDTFEAAGLGSIPARSAAYDFMHTVMIYRGAADIKTNGAAADQALIRSNRAELEGVGRRLDLLSGRRDAEARSEEENVLRELVGRMRDWGARAVARTKSAVQAEHATNAVDRGKPATAPKAPPDGKVDEAFARQLEDIGLLGRRAHRAGL